MIAVVYKFCITTVPKCKVDFSDSAILMVRGLAQSQSAKRLTSVLQTEIAQSAKRLTSVF